MLNDKVVSLALPNVIMTTLCFRY